MATLRLRQATGSGATILSQREAGLLEPKQFYRDMERLLSGAPTTRSRRRFCEWLAPRLFETFGSTLGLRGVHLYAASGNSFAHVRSDGEAGADLGADLTRHSHAHSETAEAWPWAGDTADGPSGVMSSPCGGFVFALTFPPGAAATGPDGMLPVVSLFQYTIAQHERQRELENLMEQARAIQTSLLPAAPPAFGTYDIAAASIPAETVGGDFFDLHLLEPETLAIVVSDASGHGLPAALQARDVATGLRMGLERDLRLTRTIEKLNRVIHRSGLVTRFVSLVLGELELNGNLTYVNAGHPPPLLLDDAGVHELGVGGTLLGPYADSTYKLGFAHVDRGAALVLYSDGVVEAGTRRGEAFGAERLAEWLRAWREGPADEAVGDLLERLRGFGGGTAFEDDLTVVFVRRPR
jgi:sigma-B regulation protein RsbU (phosphoserine phosphatase)